ncbi:MAG: tetratricopeptide repeat protein [Sulfuritalea sp.]|nr:tetratricopeptide repeat protein [Sulfuritalea sp.]
MTQILLNAARLLASAVSVALLSLAPAVHADTLQDISKQIRQGQHSQAMEQIDKYLAAKPKDAQGRFLKGILLTEMNKPNEAIAIFTKLTEDYPELPEPYNNLAVIYAQQKQYDKAKQALEMAIRTHPSYATAHENLGDLYARLASQAYDKALQIDSSNSSAQNKLALIRDLMITASRPGKATKPIGDPRPVDPVKLAEAPKSAPAPATAPLPPPVAPVVAPAAPVAVVATPAPGKPVEAARPAPAKSADDATAEIDTAIAQWAAAWSRKDVKAYLAAYARDFKTPAGESRAAWDAERRKRIAKPGTIQVSYENLRVTVDGDNATVKFRQHYKSASLKTSSNKVLVMGKRDGKWQILQERVGS